MGPGLDPTRDRTTPLHSRIDPSRLGYLVVDEFLDDLIGFRGVASAFERGWLHALARGGRRPEDLPQADACDPRGVAFLLEILLARGVIEQAGDQVRFTPRFQEAFRYQDLMQAKIAFATHAVPDFLESLNALVEGQGAFIPRSRTFELFRYDRALDLTPENLQATRRWVRITTGLTRYEAPILGDLLAWDGVRTILDLGGNSGELLRCLTHDRPGLSGTVFDLPAVCQVGAEWVAAHPEPGDVRFVPGDLRQQDPPGGFDRVVTKSVLHDWPAADVPHLLAAAWKALRPGGDFVIFERAPIRLDPGAPLPGIPMIHSLVFLHCYHEASFYRDALDRAGFEEIRCETVALEMPFHLIRAVRPR